MCWGSFLRDCCVILVSFWCHFGVILVSVWCPWGSFGDPGAPRVPLKGPGRKTDEKVGSLVAFWHPQGVPLGSNFRYFLCFFGVFCSLFFETLFGRLLGSLGTCSNHKNIGFVYTKALFSHFYLEFPKNRKWHTKGTFWDAFGWFWEVLGTILGDEKIVAKIERQKVMQRTPGAPGSSRERALFH